jgi:hypothetical protein
MKRRHGESFVFVAMLLVRVFAPFALLAVNLPYLSHPTFVRFVPFVVKKTRISTTRSSLSS